jgi:hypothetical protein
MPHLATEQAQDLINILVILAYISEPRTKEDLVKKFVKKTPVSSEVP